MLLIDMIQNPYYITYVIFIDTLFLDTYEQWNQLFTTGKLPCPSHEDKSLLCGEPMETRDNRYYQTVERIPTLSTQNNDLPITIVSVTSIFRFFVQYVGYKVIHCIHGGSFTNVQNVQEFH